MMHEVMTGGFRAVMRELTQAMQQIARDSATIAATNAVAPVQEKQDRMAEEQTEIMFGASS